MTLWAREGERVTCENGHRIATVARDIHGGEFGRDPSRFVDWCFGIEPEIGSTPPPCQCGAPWWIGGNSMHFEDGYR